MCQELYQLFIVEYKIRKYLGMALLNGERMAQAVEETNDCIGFIAQKWSQHHLHEVRLGQESKDCPTFQSLTR